MSPAGIIILVALYFAFLIGVSWITGKNADATSFYLGNKKSPWWAVAYGMIGASLSGVTFISVPGWVKTSQFSYMQMVLGYLLGYIIIASILLPLYYRLNLTSIYSYLEQRFGSKTHKSGATLFLISRVIGAAFRLYLVAIVFQTFVFEKLGWNVPFFITVSITILLIWVYTFKSGIKTIVWTDTLQTTFMLAAVIITIITINEKMDWNFSDMYQHIANSSYSKMFFFENINDKKYFWKQFFAGASIALVMTGLDQDMMQKNLSCKSLKDAQKNMLSFSFVLIFVNLMFLSLGALLLLFAEHHHIAVPEKGDYLFPTLAINGYLGASAGLFFVLGLIAAAYSSADSALTALTTSFCFDILGFDKKLPENSEKIRFFVHIGFSILLLLVIVIFKAIHNESVISQLFKFAGYTYGPLLGLYAFGLFMKNHAPVDAFIPAIVILSPIISYGLNQYSDILFNGYKFGFELLIINGIITFFFIWIISVIYAKKPLR